jgi:hypothetical protein
MDVKDWTVFGTGSIWVNKRSLQLGGVFVEFHCHPHYISFSYHTVYRAEGRLTVSHPFNGAKLSLFSTTLRKEPLTRESYIAPRISNYLVLSDNSSCRTLDSGHKS